MSSSIDFIVVATLHTPAFSGFLLSIGVLAHATHGSALVFMSGFIVALNELLRANILRDVISADIAVPPPGKLAIRAFISRLEA